MGRPTFALKSNVAPKNQVIMEAPMQSMASDQSWFTWRMQSRNMKPSIILAITLVFCLVVIAGGNTKLLTADPLTNLPLYPATDSRLHLGNEPTRLPESNVCGSKMQADFYTVYDSKVDATLGWYGAHLPGFKKNARLRRQPLARYVLQRRRDLGCFCDRKLGQSRREH